MTDPNPSTSPQPTPVVETLRPVAHLQLKAMADYMQAGLLVAQEDESLTLRATRDALTKLDANPERLFQ